MAALKSNLIIGAMFLLLAVGMTFWGWRIFSEVVPAKVLVGEITADLTLHGVELKSGQNGTIEWTLTARQAEYDISTEAVDLESPRITYFGTAVHGEPLAVEASQGRVMREENTARLWPDVRAVSGDVLVESSEMEYLGGERKIVLSGDVTLTRPGSMVRASRAELDLDRQTITLTGGVRARMDLDLIPQLPGGVQ
jgi:LPS export ABC transporter protein LptC